MVSSLVQADPQLFDVETGPVLSPEERLSKGDGLKLAGGALAAGAGLAFIKNYWNKPATSTSNTYYKPITSSNTYYKPITSSNTYYKPVTTSNTYYKPVTSSNTYYKPGYNQYQYYLPNNQYPGYYHHPASLAYPPHYQQDQQFSQYRPSAVHYVKPYSGLQTESMQHNQEEDQAPDEDTEELEQRIMEDEGLYSIGMMELPPESRGIKKLLAGGAGLAAGYYLTNKYNEYKNNNKYGANKLFSSSSKPSYHYPAYPHHHQPGYRPSYHHNYRPAYPAYHHYRPSYRPTTHNRYQTSSSSSSSSRPTYYSARDLQARSDSTCFPELVLSVGGNHLYKCRGLEPVVYI